MDEDENREKFRKWIDLAKQTRPNSRFLSKPTDQYLSDEIKAGVYGPYWVYVGIETASVCTSTNKPNIWFSINADNLIRIGLAFNSNASVEIAKNILAGHSQDVRARFFTLLKSQPGWRSIVQMRKKLHNHAEQPIYEEVASELICDLDDEKIAKLFNTAHETINTYRVRTKLPIEDPNHLVTGGGVSFDLVEKSIPASEEEFKKAFMFVHDVLEICLEIKTVAQYKKEQPKTRMEKPYFPFPKRYQPKTV